MSTSTRAAGIPQPCGTIDAIMAISAVPSTRDQPGGGSIGLIAPGRAIRSTRVTTSSSRTSFMPPATAVSCSSSCVPTPRLCLLRLLPDGPFDETLVRHAIKPQAVECGVSVVVVVEGDAAPVCDARAAQEDPADRAVADDDRGVGSVRREAVHHGGARIACHVAQ